MTPLEKGSVFGKSLTLTLTLEKRGYAPESVEITPTSETTRVSLRRIREAGQPEIPEYSLPQSGVLLLVSPAMKVIKRGFSSEAWAVGKRDTPDQPGTRRAGGPGT